jgi:hypothetical protein
MMVTLVMSEWHEVERRLVIKVDKALIKQVYPDLTTKEVSQVLKKLEAGDKSDLAEFINDAQSDGELEWEHDYDDWHTMIKGGFAVTYSTKAND